jgi:hypothetical protein
MRAGFGLTFSRDPFAADGVNRKCFKPAARVFAQPRAAQFNILKNEL